jgi:hypothetical protein
MTDTYWEHPDWDVVADLKKHAERERAREIGLVFTKEHTIVVLHGVALERQRQDKKWDEQNHRDGTGDDRLLLRGAHVPGSGQGEHAMRPTYGTLAYVARLACQAAHRKGDDAWDLVLLEEVFEAMAEDDPVTLRAELIQVAAVAVNWIECIDRRTAKEELATREELLKGVTLSDEAKRELGIDKGEA